MLLEKQIQEDKDLRCLAEYRRTQDQRILDRLLIRFEPVKWTAVEKVCQLRGIRDPNLKDDIGQYASFGVLKALATYKANAGTSLSSWVYSKAEGYARNALKQHGKMRIECFSEVFHTERAFNEAMAKQHTVESREQYEQMIRQQKHAIIRKTIDGLPEPHRTVTIQIYYKRRTQAEVAKERGVSQPAIHYMLDKACDMVCERLDSYFEGNELDRGADLLFEKIWFHRISGAKLRYL